jgi:hypothetical protein
MGVDGWGGCPNDLRWSDHWSWIWRNRSSGDWYYFWDTALYHWGRSPTYAVAGNANWGGAVGIGTVSCP